MRFIYLYLWLSIGFFTLWAMLKDDESTVADKRNRKLWLERPGQIILALMSGPIGLLFALTALSNVIIYRAESLTKPPK